jgi:plastocyanin
VYKKIVIVLLALAALSTLAACQVIDASKLVTGTPVHMGNAAFKLPEISIKKGDKLDLIDDVAVNHVIANGYWNGSNAVTKKEAGAPTVNVSITGGSAAVGPFTQAGSYMLLCTVHGGMQIKVNVS